jgi:hypothetical protein
MGLSLIVEATNFSPPGLALLRKAPRIKVCIYNEYSSDTDKSVSPIPIESISCNTVGDNLSLEEVICPFLRGRLYGEESTLGMCRVGDLG